MVAAFGLQEVFGELQEASGELQEAFGELQEASGELQLLQESTQSQLPLLHHLDHLMQVEYRSFLYLAL